MLRITSALAATMTKIVSRAETIAYQQMMQSSQGSAKLKDLDGLGDSEEGDEEDSSEDEEDDEIEKATRLSPETPPSSRNKYVQRQIRF